MLSGAYASIIDISYHNEIHVEKGLNISLSQVTYPQIAHYVGLDPIRKLADCPQFELRRSRIPSN